MSLSIIKTSWYPETTNKFIIDRLYLKSKINYSQKLTNFSIDGFDGFSIIYIAYISYIQGYINLKQLKLFYNHSLSEIKLNQNINLLEFIYLTAFGRIFNPELFNIFSVKTIIPSYNLILYLQKRLKENKDFILYKKFYKNYSTFKIPNYDILEINKSVIKRSNQLLGSKFYTIDMYKQLNNDDKKFLLNLFYTKYINDDNYINIHPIIFNFNMYKDFIRKITVNKVSNSINIIIGESFNKLGLIMDMMYKTNSYYIPFSKTIYKNDKFKIDKKYKKYLNINYLSSFKSIINNIIPYDKMLECHKIYMYDQINSGKGILSFVYLFNIMFPEFKNKIHLILVSDTINSKYKLYYSSNNSSNIRKKLDVKFNIYNLKCNKYILDIFTQEIYNNRCFKYLPIDDINNNNINIFQKYNNKINMNNLIKFYIIYRFHM